MLMIIGSVWMYSSADYGTVISDILDFKNKVVWYTQRSRSSTNTTDNMLVKIRSYIVYKPSNLRYWQNWYATKTSGHGVCIKTYHFIRFMYYLWLFSPNRHMNYAYIYIYIGYNISPSSHMHVGLYPIHDIRSPVGQRYISHGLFRACYIPL